MRQLVQNLFDETTENKLGVTFRQHSGCHHQTTIKNNMAKFQNTFNLTGRKSTQYDYKLLKKSSS